MKRRVFLKQTTAALAIPGIARASSASVLRFVPVNDLTAVDPIWTGEYRTRNHGYLVFDTLYGQTGPAHNFTVSPQMAAGQSRPVRPGSDATLQ